MHGRKPEEIKNAIIEAIMGGSRSLRDIRLNADISTDKCAKRYVNILFNEGKIKVDTPSFFDHGNVKKVYLINLEPK